MRKALIGVIVFLSVLTFPITVWFSWEGLDVFKNLVREFSDRTGIDVKVVYVPKNADDKLLMAWKAQTGLPDVLMLKNDEIARVIDALEVLKIPEGISKKALEAFEIDGKLYAVPIYADIGGVFFARKGVKDADFEDLVEKYKAEKNAILLPIYGKYFFQVFQRTFGGKTDLTLEDESTKKALEFLLWLKREVPYTPKDGRSAIALFMKGEGKVLMFGSFLISKFVSKGVDFKILEPPLLRSAGRRISPNLDYKGFAVVKGRMSDEVRKFLDFVSSGEFQRRLCGKLYKIPSNEKARISLKEEPIFSKLLEYEKYGSPTPSSKSAQRYYEAVGAMLKLMAAGYDDVGEILKAGRKVIGSR